MHLGESRFSIADILKFGENVNITATVKDLKEFVYFCIEEGKKLSSQNLEQDADLSLAQVAKMLGVTTNTLWRWEKTGYLKPYRRIGKRPVYKLSQIKLIGGQANG